MDLKKKKERENLPHSYYCRPPSIDHISAFGNQLAFTMSYSILWLHGQDLQCFFAIFWQQKSKKYPLKSAVTHFITVQKKKEL